VKSPDHWLTIGPKITISTMTIMMTPEVTAARLRSTRCQASAHRERPLTGACAMAAVKGSSLATSETTICPNGLNIATYCASS
jgi:hypothetical protein